MTASDQEDAHTESIVCSCFLCCFYTDKKGRKIIRSPPFEDNYVSRWRYVESFYSLCPYGDPASTPVYQRGHKQLYLLTHCTKTKYNCCTKTKPVQGLVNSEEFDITLQEDAVEEHCTVVMVFTSVTEQKLYWIKYLEPNTQRFTFI